MTPWFSASEVSPVPKRKVSVKEAAKVLYQSASSRWEPADRSRFSSLLLEHGERHLQDWAVTASSEIIKRSGSSISSTSKTQWNQSGRSRKVGPNIKRSKPKRTPETTMRNVEGRLHLCSRSLLFEPLDSMRGIIRCPFARMDCAPREVPGDAKHTKKKELSNSFLSGSYETITPLKVDCLTSRHFVVMENGLVGPYDSAEVPAKFCFTFLHSCPESFVELCQVRISHIVSLSSIVYVLSRLASRDCTAWTRRLVMTKLLSTRL